MNRTLSPNPSGEVRLSRPTDLASALSEIGLALDSGRCAYALLAAEGTAAQLYFAPFEAFQANALGSLPGRGAAERGFTLVTRIAWTPAAYWLAPTFHDVSTVQEHFVENPVDAVPLAIFLNLLEIARGRKILGDLDQPAQAVKLMEIAERWLDQVGRQRFDELLPGETGPLGPKEAGAIFGQKWAGPDERIEGIRHRPL